MELLSNLIWVMVSVLLLAATWRAGGSGMLRVRRRSALVLVALVCVLLLPILSSSDDVLEAQQMTLPIAAQTWHMAAQDASPTVDILSFACLALLVGALLLSRQRPLQQERRSAYSDWIARAYGLRPPPAFAL